MGFWEHHSITETGLVIVVGAVAIIAACYQEWTTAAAIVTGAFAILRGRKEV